MRPRTLLVDCLIALTLTALLLAAATAGHSAGVWFPTRWESGFRNQDYGFENGLPSGAFRERIEDGAKEWNAIGVNMQFHRAGGMNVTWEYSTACGQLNRGDNAVFWGPIDGPFDPNDDTNIVAQVTLNCTAGSFLKVMQMKFDSAQNFYTGTGDPGSNQDDVWSFAAHEFGHAGGFSGHWNQNPDGPNADPALCNDPPPKHTMCKSLTMGTRVWRSLEEHDRETFRNAYN